MGTPCADRQVQRLGIETGKGKQVLRKIVITGSALETHANCRPSNLQLGNVGVWGGGGLRVEHDSSNS